MACGDAVERGFLSMGEVLVLLTGCTSFDIFSDPLLHTFPRMMLLGSSYGFVLPRVSSGRVVMHHYHEVALHFFAYDFFQSRRGYEAFGWENYYVLVVVFPLVNTRWS